MRLPLLLLIAAPLMLAAPRAAANSDKVRIVGGWDEVTNKWPLEQEEYFITTYRGHNSIELELDEAPADGLQVKLQYFYGYERVKPVIQLVACSLQKDIVRGDWEIFPQPRQWLHFDHLIGRDDCRRIVFNVILHDKGDVFAWRYMEVRAQNEQPYRFTTTAAPATTTTTEAATTAAAAATTAAAITTTTTIAATTTTTAAAPSRRKRSAGFQTLVCQPSSCDRNMFKLRAFRTLLKGLPQVSAQQLEEGKRLFVNLLEEPLEFLLDSSSEPSQVDSCVDLQLHMDAGTELQFRLDYDAHQGRLLELLKPQDSTAGQWDSFKRCLSDYMPRATASEGPMRLVFEPKPMAPGKLIGLLADARTSVSERKLFPIHEYLPDVRTLQSESEVEKYWIFDRDGIRKPSLSIEGSSQTTGSNVLRVSQIEPKQESFDLTSRWLKVPAELLEGDNKQLLFNYQLERAHWIKAIEFEYQNADQWAPQSWIRQVVYTEAPADGTTTTTTTAANPTDLIPLAIRLLNLGPEEFRMRIRHLVKPEAGPLDHQLVIKSLAFGDVCSGANYCQNDGQCRSLGAGRAECTCPAGYSGQHCEQVRPCEVIFNGRTGKELCESIGAQCVVHLPVFRCLWPNDRYFYSQVLYQVDADGNPSAAAAAALTPDQLKEKADKQSRLIIVLSVFMVAMLLFAVVIVANMVARLVKSKRNLKTVQMEVVELTRRSADLPSTSTSAYAGRPHSGLASAPANRGKRPVSGVSYSNQSFSAD